MLEKNNKVDELRRYENFGWDYKLINPIPLKEAKWYLSWANESKGPVLELACGTGRLLCLIAKAGIECVGLDLSPTMLSLAQENKRQLTSEARKNIFFQKADISSFSLQRKFSTVILADNSFSIFQKSEKQSACLETVSRHLFTDGLLLISVRRFEGRMPSSGQTQTGWSKPFINPNTGLSVTRNVSTRVDRRASMIYGEYQYKLKNAKGFKKIYRFPFANPIMTKSDYIALFKETGFKAKIYSDYSLRKTEVNARMLCFVASKIKSP